MSKHSVQQMTEIFRVFGASQSAIRPHFILTGPSGSGKSWTILQLCELFDLNYLEINAAQLTKEGLSGNSLSKALAPLGNFSNRPTVCFVDEFDKLIIAGNSNSDLAHESTTGVQNEFLKVLESRTTAVFSEYGKYRDITVDNVLFIFVGAFNGEENIDLNRLQELGLKTEFLGRVGLCYNMERLSYENMMEILNKNELVKLYSELYDVDHSKAVADIAVEVKAEYDKNILGARLINTLAHQYFLNGCEFPKQIVKKSVLTKLEKPPKMVA